MAFYFIIYNTLLHFCAIYSNFQAMVATLACKADPNICNSYHITPLFMTIWKGFLHLAGILLQAKADPNIPDQIFFFNIFIKFLFINFNQVFFFNFF